MSKAFAAVLATNGGGALLNVLSIVSWVNGGQLAAYAASKAAGLVADKIHCATNWRRRKRRLLALHMGFVDTDLVRAIDSPENEARRISSSAHSMGLKPALTRCWLMSAQG